MTDGFGLQVMLGTNRFAGRRFTDDRFD